MKNLHEIVEQCKEPYLALNDGALQSENMGELVHALNRKPEIKRLYLQHNELDSDALFQLSLLEHIEMVDLSHNNIADSGLDLLLKNPVLKEIHLDVNNISDKGLGILDKAAQHNQKTITAGGNPGYNSDSYPHLGATATSVQSKNSL